MEIKSRVWEPGKKTSQYLGQCLWVAMYCKADLRIMDAKYTASIMSLDLIAKDLSSSSTLKLGRKLKTSCTIRKQHQSFVGTMYAYPVQQRQEANEFT